MVSYWHKNSQAAYLICCLSHLNKWQHYVVEFFQFFWGVGKSGLLPNCLIRYHRGAVSSMCYQPASPLQSVPIYTGVRYAKILLIKWVRWVICKTTHSHTQFHTGRRFTPHKHDHNGQDRKKLKETWNCTKKTRWLCAKIQRGYSHSPDMITMGQDRKSKRERKSVEILPINKSTQKEKKEGIQGTKWKDIQEDKRTTLEAKPQGEHQVPKPHWVPLPPSYCKKHIIE